MNVREKTNEIKSHGRNKKELKQKGQKGESKSNSQTKWVNPKNTRNNNGLQGTNPMKENNQLTHVSSSPSPLPNQNPTHSLTSQHDRNST